MRSKVMVAAASLLAACGLCGCRFGEAGFSGDLGGRAFDPGGTVFAYVDKRDDNLVEEARPRVAVVMTWLIFDPQGDLNDLEGSELEDHKHELRLRDAIALVFADQGQLVPGTQFESVIEDGVETGSGELSARVHLSPERLDESSTYGSFIPFASRRRVQVNLEEVSFTDGRVLAGDVSVDLERSGLDPGDALIGRVEGRFRAPLVDERVAEHNLSLLAVDDILGVPLPPREEAP